MTKEHGPNITPVISPLVQGGAFHEFRLIGARERVGQALKKYLTPLFETGTLQSLAVAYDGNATPEYPFGNIRLLTILAHGKEGEEAAQKAAQETQDKYPDLPIKFYSASRSAEGNLNQEIFRQFSQGIVPHLIDVNELKRDLSQ